MDLIICTSASWWQHPWTLTYMNSVCWDQTEQMETWETVHDFHVKDVLEG